MEVMVLIGLFFLASYLAYGAGYSVGRLRSERSINSFMDDLLSELPQDYVHTIFQAAVRLKDRYRREAGYDRTPDERTP